LRTSSAVNDYGNYDGRCQDGKYLLERENDGFPQKKDEALHKSTKELCSIVAAVEKMTAFVENCNDLT
jgi:hypothetical protein